MRKKQKGFALPVDRQKPKHNFVKWTDPLSVRFSNYSIKAEEIIGFYKEKDEARELLESKLSCKKSDLVMLFEITGINVGFFLVPTLSLGNGLYVCDNISVCKIQFIDESKSLDFLDTVKRFDSFLFALVKLFVKLAKDKRVMSDTGTIDINSLLDFVDDGSRVFL